MIKPPARRSMPPKTGNEAPTGVPSTMSWSRAVSAPTIQNITTSMPYFLTGTLAIRLRADLDISEFGLGALFSVFAVGAAATAMATGWLAERVGPGPSLRAAGVAAGAVLLAIPLLADGWLSYAILFALAGVASTFVQAASNLWLVRTISAHQLGLAFGVKQAGGPAGAMLAGLAVPAVAIALDWRWTFAAFGMVALAGTLSVPRTSIVRSASAVPAREGDIAIGPLSVIAAGVGMATAASVAFIGFAVVGAVDYGGMTESAAGALFAAGAVVGIIARVALGAATDRGWGSPFEVTALLVAMGSGGFVLLSTGTAIAFVIGVPLSFVTAWGWSGVLHQAVSEAHQGAPARATGIIQTGVCAGVFVGPLAFGLIAGQSFAVAWLATAGTSLGASATLLVGVQLMRRGTSTGGAPAPAP
jgi:MFS family permease